MKLKQLLSSLESRQQAFVDIVVNSKFITYENDILNLSKAGIQYESKIYDNETRQELSGRIGLPMSYFSVLYSGHEKELSRTVNYWLRYSKKQMLIRCVKREGYYLECRGILSNKYHIINHYDAISEIVTQINKKLNVAPELVRYVSETSSQKMLIELDIPSLKTDIGHITGSPGDFATMGLYLGNSELGRGVFYMQPYVRLSNGSLLILDETFTRVHLGKEIECGVYEFGDHPLSLGLNSVFELIHSLIDVLTKDKLLKTVEDLYSILGGIVPKSKTDSIEAYLKALGTNTQEGVEVLNNYLTSYGSALDAFFSVSKALDKISPHSDNYDKLYNARVLAETFGNIKKRKA